MVGWWSACRLLYRGQLEPASILGRPARTSRKFTELPKHQSSTAITSRIRSRIRKRARTIHNVSVETPCERCLRLEPARQARKVGREPRQHRGCDIKRNRTKWRTHTSGMFSPESWRGCASAERGLGLTEAIGCARRRSPVASHGIDRSLRRGFCSAL